MSLMLNSDSRRCEPILGGSKPDPLSSVVQGGKRAVRQSSRKREPFAQWLGLTENEWLKIVSKVESGEWYVKEAADRYGLNRGSLSNRLSRAGVVSTAKAVESAQRLRVAVEMILDGASSVEASREAGVAQSRILEEAKRLGLIETLRERKLRRIRASRAHPRKDVIVELLKTGQFKQSVIAERIGCAESTVSRMAKLVREGRV